MTTVQERLGQIRGAMAAAVRVGNSVWFDDLRREQYALWQREHDDAHDRAAVGEQERRIVYAVLDWIRITREAGFTDPCHPDAWPTRADADHSGLLARLLHGGTVYETVEEYRAGDGGAIARGR